jgi:hypothetical protein
MDQTAFTAECQGNLPHRLFDAIGCDRSQEDITDDSFSIEIERRRWTEDGGMSV